MKTYIEYIKENTEYKSFNDIIEQYSSNIPTIDASSKHLKDLNGIEKFIQLQSLWCYHNKINSLVPLTHLTEMDFLSCYNNKLESFKGLPENVTYLLCYNNPLDNWQEDVEAFVRAYKCSSYLSKEWFDEQKRFNEIIDLIKINMI